MSSRLLRTIAALWPCVSKRLANRCEAGDISCVWALGAFDADRTLRRAEVLTDHVGTDMAFTEGDLEGTTGTHITVDSGVAAAFLR